MPKLLDLLYWNLKSVSVHNFSKVFLLRAFISIHKFDGICISETLLNSDRAYFDDNLKIEGYNTVRSDHLSNYRRGSVCIFYKQSLALKILDFKYLQEGIIFRVLIGNELYNLFSYIDHLVKLLIYLISLQII